MNPSDQARQVGVVDSWLGQYGSYGGVTNPGAGAVLADVGALPAGFYDVEAVISYIDTTGVDSLQLQHRDAANAVSLLIAYVQVNAGSNNTIPIYWRNYKVAVDERFRVIAGGGFTGFGAASIRAVRRA
jgi:hypothetical protein